MTIEPGLFAKAAAAAAAQVDFEKQASEALGSYEKFAAFVKRHPHLYSEPLIREVYDHPEMHKHAIGQLAKLFSSGAARLARLGRQAFGGVAGGVKALGRGAREGASIAKQMYQQGSEAAGELGGALLNKADEAGALLRKAKKWPGNKLKELKGRWDDSPSAFWESFKKTRRGTPDAPAPKGGAPSFHSMERKGNEARQSQLVKDIAAAEEAKELKGNVDEASVLRALQGESGPATRAPTSQRSTGGSKSQRSTGASKGRRSSGRAPTEEMDYQRQQRTERRRQKAERRRQKTNQGSAGNEKVPTDLADRSLSDTSLSDVPLSDVPMSALPKQLAERYGNLTPGQIAEYIRESPWALPAAGMGAGYLMSDENQSPAIPMALGGLGGYLGRGFM